MYLREWSKILNLSNHQFQTSFIAFRSIKRWVSPTLKELKRRKDKMTPESEPRRSTFIDWNYNAEIFAFSKRLNENFDTTALQQAFTQRSYIIQEEMKQKEVGVETPTIGLKDNKELIKAGEGIIAEYVEKFLIESLPKVPEDGRHAIKKYLMAEDILANISSHIGTKDIILSAEFPVDKSTLSDTLKAIIGALEVSSGTVRAYEFVRDFICTQLNGVDIDELWDINNPIEILNDIYKNKGELEPRLIGESAMNTLLATFQVGIYLNKQLLGSGFGESILIAHEMAARDALKTYFGINDSMRPFNYTIPVQNEEAKLRRES